MPEIVDICEIKEHTLITKLVCFQAIILLKVSKLLTSLVLKLSQHLYCTGK